MPTERDTLRYVAYEDATAEQLAQYDGHPSNAPSRGDVLMFRPNGTYYGYERGSTARRKAIEQREQE